MKRTGIVLAIVAMMLLVTQAMAVETAVMAMYTSPDGQQFMTCSITSDRAFDAYDVDYVLAQSQVDGYVGATTYEQVSPTSVYMETEISPINPERQFDLPDGTWNVLNANITIHFEDGSSAETGAADSVYSVVDGPARQGEYSYATDCEPIVPTIIPRNFSFCAWICHGSYVIPIECEDPDYYPDPSILEVTVTNGCDPAETHCNDPNCPRVDWGVFNWFKRVRPNCQLYLVFTYCVAEPGCVCIYRSDFYLPVEMTSFAATPGNGQVSVSWSTASETNSDVFIISRSDDGPNGLFHNVGSVGGAGTSAESHSYTWVDNEVENGKTYYYKLGHRDTEGNLHLYAEDGQVVLVSATPDVDAGMPLVYSLAQNYPNPFNSQTSFNFAIPAADHVSLKVFDLMGREVATVIDGQMKAGSHTVNWTANNIATGVYMYTLTSGNFTQTKKLLYLK